MSRIRLEIEDSFDFRVIGVSCHEKDYRLVWALNSISGFDFTRMDDLKTDQDDKKAPGFLFMNSLTKNISKHTSYWQTASATPFFCRNSPPLIFFSLYGAMLMTTR